MTIPVNAIILMLEKFTDMQREEEAEDRWPKERKRCVGLFRREYPIISSLSDEDFLKVWHNAEQRFLPKNLTMIVSKRDSSGTWIKVPDGQCEDGLKLFRDWKALRVEFPRLQKLSTKLLMAAILSLVVSGLLAAWALVGSGGAQWIATVFSASAFCYILFIWSLIPKRLKRMAAEIADLEKVLHDHARLVKTFCLRFGFQPCYFFGTDDQDELYRSVRKVLLVSARSVLRHLRQNGIDRDRMEEHFPIPDSLVRSLLMLEIEQCVLARNLGFFPWDVPAGLDDLYAEARRRL